MGDINTTEDTLPSKLKDLEANFFTRSDNLFSQIEELESSLKSQGINPITDRNYMNAIRLYMDVVKDLLKKLSEIKGNLVKETIKKDNTIKVNPKIYEEFKDHN